MSHAKIASSYILNVVDPSATRWSLAASSQPWFFHPDANHEMKVFNDLPKGDFIDDTPSLHPCFHLPAARRTYIGGNKLRVSCLYKLIICWGYLLTKCSGLSMTHESARVSRDLNTQLESSSQQVLCDVGLYLIFNKIHSSLAPWDPTFFSSLTSM